MVLKGIGCSFIGWPYPMGWEICIMNISSSNKKKDTILPENEKNAIKIFEEHILPQIKKYIKEVKKSER
jgi:hypothetical protein